MAKIVNIQSHDDQFLYQISAQAMGPQEASVSERKQDKTTGAVTNSTIQLTNIAIVNGVLKGTGHFLGGLTQDVYLEPSQPGDNLAETIKTGGFAWGLGAQRLGPYQVSAEDYAAVNAWFENFPRS
jgi:hypothetical protein